MKNTPMQALGVNSTNIQKELNKQGTQIMSNKQNANKQRIAKERRIQIAKEQHDAAAVLYKRLKTPEGLQFLRNMDTIHDIAERPALKTKFIGNETSPSFQTWVSTLKLPTDFLKYFDEIVHYLNEIYKPDNLTPKLIKTLILECTISSIKKKKTSTGIRNRNNI